MLPFGVCLCFVVHYFVSFLVFQSSWRGRESWLICFCSLTVLLMFCDSSSRCWGMVCGVWLWYFQIILFFTEVEIFQNPVCNYLSGFWCSWLCINKDRIWSKNLVSNIHLSHLLAEAVVHSKKGIMVLLVQCCLRLCVWPCILDKSVCILFLVWHYFLWRVVLSALCGGPKKSSCTFI